MFVFKLIYYMHIADTILSTARIPTIERPFVPDGAKDIDGIWSRQDQITPQQRLAKPNAMMFFHIPLCVLSNIITRPRLTSDNIS